MDNILIKNKRAYFEFEISETFIAGIQLTGTEVKSLREGKANINDVFCFVRKGELWARNMHISEYDKSSFYQHEPKRERKLLLNKKELKKIEAKVKEKGFTIVALKLFFSKTGYAKLEIGLAKGKKLYDKRESLKEKDIRRQVERGEY